MDFDIFREIGISVIYYLSPLLMLAGIAGFVTSVALLMIGK